MASENDFFIPTSSFQVFYLSVLVADRKGSFVMHLNAVMSTESGSVTMRKLRKHLLEVETVRSSLNRARRRQRSVVDIANVTLVRQSIAISRC